VTILGQSVAAILVVIASFVLLILVVIGACLVTILVGQWVYDRIKKFYASVGGRHL
jgi:hypothetical protein